MKNLMNNSRQYRTSRIALGVVAALAIAACGSDDETTSATTERPEDPCAPVGELNSPADTELNDRCVSVGGGELEWDELNFAELEIWTLTDSSCGSPVLITAMPGEVLVTSDTPEVLDEAVAQVVGLIPAEFEARLDVDDVGAVVPTAELITVDASIDEILKLVPILQGVGWSADLNYLEPLQPNNGFRPADDPRRFDAANQGLPSEQPVDSGEAQVLVLDATADQQTFDLDGNDRWDEDHGHGQFVQSIIDRLAPGAGVRLAAVTSSADRLPSGRWAPMMFSDMDILTAMYGAVGDDSTYEFVNMSLGGPGCSTSRVGHGIGERLALSRGMRSMSADDTTFIAAAGNQGGDVKHFPAAWRDGDATVTLAEAVEALPDTHVDIAGDPVPVGDVADDIRALHEYFLAHMYAVGSVEEDGSASTFSNCGAWVNATAYGSKQVGYYPHPDNVSNYATWSGTSFATANVTAALASGSPSAGVTVGVDGLACL